MTTAFVGIWGMNFEAMPELEWHLGYPIALAGHGQCQWLAVLAFP